MAKRGRPPKKAKVVEEIKEEQTQDDVNKFVEEGISTDVEIDIKDVDYQEKGEPDIYDLNTPKSIPGPDYSPFSENVIEKDYRTPQVATAPSIPDISEPAFQKPTYDDLIASNEENVPEEQQEKTGFDAFAQNTDGQVSKEEEETNADGLVEVCYVAYGVLNQFGGKAARISNAKLSKYESEGLLDRKMPVPVDANTTATVEEIVESLNTQVDDIFVVSDDFKERTRPLMKRIFLKRGWGVSDEQQLLIYVATDIQEKVVAAMQIRKSAKFQLDSFAAMYEQKLEMDRKQAKAEFVAAGVEEKMAQNEDKVETNDEVFSVETPIEEVEEKMVKTQNPDIKVSKHDLDQIDVDNV